jgi:lipoprotein signal peptidase
VLARRARLYDALALLTAVVVISLDQWTKALVVANLNPPGSKPDIPLLGQYLVIAYIQNNGAAFSLFKDQNNFLAIFILLAIGVIASMWLILSPSASLKSIITSPFLMLRMPVSPLGSFSSSYWSRLVVCIIAQKATRRVKILLHR